MGYYDSKCALKTLSIMSGLAAAGVLAVSIMISPWAEIYDRKLATNAVVAEDADEFIEVTPDGRASDSVGSGSVSEDFAMQPQRAILVGLWKLCLLNYGDVVNEAGSPCWATSPFDGHLHPPQIPGTLADETLAILALVKDHHFHIPLLVCLGLTVLAVLVTSGGMARNNVVVLIGASFYEFAALVMAVSVMWFIHVIRHDETDDFRYMLGEGVYYAGLSFLSLHVAAAMAITTYRQRTQKIRRRVSRKLSKRDIVLIGQTNTNTLSRF